MLQLQYRSFKIPFQYPFTLAKGSKTHQETLIVKLGMGRHYGVGEATAIPYYNIAVDEMIAALEQNRQVIERYAFNGPERFGHFAHHLFSNNNFLASALDCAAWDLHGKMRHESVHALLGLKWTEMKSTSYTLGMSSSAELMQKIKDHSYPIYKLKLGKDNAALALETVLNNTEAQLRLDANESWNRASIEKLLPLLRSEKIELIEQPTAADDLETLKFLRETVGCPIIADEACASKMQLAHCLENYDGINLKLSKYGGITPTFAMAKEIKIAGKKIMLGCMSESTVGTAAMLQLSPLADYIDLDGPLLQTQATAKGLSYDAEGHAALATNVGIGVEL